jgi:hypothetical protein
MAVFSGQMVACLHDSLDHGTIRINQHQNNPIPPRVHVATNTSYLNFRIHRCEERLVPTECQLRHTLLLNTLAQYLYLELYKKSTDRTALLPYPLNRFVVDTSAVQATHSRLRIEGEVISVPRLLYGAPTECTH